MAGYGFLGFLMLGLAALALLGSVLLWILGRSARQRSQEVQAKVVENVRRRGARGQPLYFPMLEFQWQGETQRVESAFGTSWEQYQPSEMVTAYYDPQMGRMTPKPTGRLGAASLALFALALLLMVGGSLFIAAQLGLV